MLDRKEIGYKSADEVHTIYRIYDESEIRESIKRIGYSTTARDKRNIVEIQEDMIKKLI